MAAIQHGDGFNFARFVSLFSFFLCYAANPRKNTNKLKWPGVAAAASSPTHTTHPPDPCTTAHHKVVVPISWSGLRMTEPSSA